MLMRDTQTVLNTWLHTKGSGTIFQIGGGDQPRVVSKSCLIICIQVFEMWWKGLLVYGKTDGESFSKCHLTHYRSK